MTHERGLQLAEIRERVKIRCASLADARELLAEVDRLTAALVGVMPWVGEHRDGPPDATPDAKRRNREMYEEANKRAMACFPERCRCWIDDNGRAVIETY